MSIYDIVPLTDRIINNFRPSRLYIKELAGIKYFGKSTAQDIESYTGSGIIWTKRIKKYGKENIKTIWISEWFYNPREIQEVALEFSRDNQIVESVEWANLRPENGLDGGRTREKSANKGKVTVMDNNGNTFQIESDSPRVISGELKSVNKGTIGVIDNSTGASMRIRVDQFHSERERYKTFVEGKKRDENSPPHWLTGKITAKDKTGKTLKIDVKDPRLVSGEIVPANTGMVSVSDTTGKSFLVCKDDPRYLSGEYRFNGGPKPGFTQEIVVCPYCNKSGGKSNMTRHHFNNCKLKS